MLCRYCFYKRKLKYCGTNVSIHDRVYILHPENIIIGNNVSIHPLSYIDGEGGITIGNQVSIAHNTTIMSSNHTWNIRNSPIKYNPKKMKNVYIGDDVWIGCGVRIMAGVNIESRCVIAANSVVTKDCRSGGLYGGVPAKLIKPL